TAAKTISSSLFISPSFRFNPCIFHEPHRIIGRFPIAKDEQSAERRAGCSPFPVFPEWVRRETEEPSYFSPEGAPRPHGRDYGRLLADGFERPVAALGSDTLRGKVANTPAGSTNGGPGMPTTYTQEGRFMSVTTPLGKDVLLLDGFSGKEGISQLF